MKKKGKRLIIVLINPTHQQRHCLETNRALMYTRLVDGNRKKYVTNVERIH